MADNLQSQNAIADAYYEYLGTIVSAICITLIIYDYVLTLDRERRYIWPRGLCGPSVLYYSLRYMPISYAIVLPYFLSPPEKSIEAYRSSIPSDDED
ncbi:hypothetical protein BD309DRAFT_1022261 [Dichomitus squalens]|uniref:Uncharacterized protein n=1 Tax=Dichomitus squalens TaxID=114155 RepID=A0A4Q9NHW9_9APHY|nr:hypothetical protein BD309DRAFT_1022261 [Dichomitus squalens]TBU60389.1 hypothetical protein BD310DRAFT_947352 [Dichomitus squalens]